MKIVFATIATAEFYYSMGADKLLRSIRRFHPEIGFKIFADDFVKSAGVPFPFLKSFAFEQLLNEYDAAVLFDADSMVVGKLTELLEAIPHYDIISVRNNNDRNMAGADPAITQVGVPVHEYMNGGLIATTSMKFVKEWQRDDVLYGNLMPFGSQTIFNALAKKYNTHILDPKEKGYYYGVSGLEGEQTHWDSWKHISVVDGQLMYNDKVIKILHHAGGYIKEKLSFDLFNEETRQRLLEICQKHEGTDSCIIL